MAVGFDDIGKPTGADRNLFTVCVKGDFFFLEIKERACRSCSGRRGGEATNVATSLPL
jgi:hypothetical protein